MMKKVLALLLAILLLLSLVACGKTEKTVSDDPDESFAESVDSEDESSEDEDSEDEDSEDEDSEDEDSEDEDSEDEESSQTNKSTTKKSTTKKKKTSSLVTHVTTKRTGKATWETPVTINTAPLFWEQHSSYDSQAEKKRQEIVNAKNAVEPSATGTTYYISPTGNDKNNGTSQLTPWKTAAPLESTTLEEGDVVLFERNAVYRAQRINMESGVSYGAYGEGPKPTFYGSDKNYADESLWISDGSNIWKTKLNTPMSNIGNIIFDYGEECGYLRLEKNLTKDFDFYEDKSGGYLYLYLSKGNPGKVYKDIELAPAGRGFFGSDGLSNVVIDNICIRYVGGHAIGLGQSSYITVQNCDIGYVGGSMQNAKVRYGNGIEFYGNGSDLTVKNNWVYQCYDAGFTNQGGQFNNLLFTENLVEYCQYDVEVWSRSPLEKKKDFCNCRYTNNILRFAGYNFQYNNRIGSNTSCAACFSAINSTLLPSDSKTVISGNVFDTSYRYLLCFPCPNNEKRGMKVAGNTWIQNSFYSDAIEDFEGSFHLETKSPVGYLLNIGKPRTILEATSQSVMEESVKKIDLAPKKVIFDGDKYMSK